MSVSIVPAVLISFVMAYHPGDTVLLKTFTTCPACNVAKSELRARNIPFIEQKIYSGVAPQLYVNGHFKGNGITAVEEYLK